MPEAARLYDPIGHSPTMNWLLQGAVAGLAIGLGAVVILGTGGLAAVAVVGGAVAGGAGIMEVLSTLSCVPKEVTGTITGKCSGNVFTNGRPAARAHVDMTFCTKHPQVPLPIATGSGNVYINGLPAARVGDKIVCGAVITAGSGNVFISGGSQKTDDVEPEELVPPLVHGVMLVAGIGAAVVLGRPVIAIAGLALGVAGGMAGAWAGAKLFGEGSDGQKLSALAGGLLGGLLGAKGGQILGAKLIPAPLSRTAEFTTGGLSYVKQAAAARLENAGGIEDINNVGFELGVRRPDYQPEGKVIQQAMPDSCVAAACRMRISDEGIDVPEAYLRADLGWKSGEGASFRNIPDALAIPENGGIVSQFSRDSMKLGALRDSIDSNGPAIANVDGHAVVVDGIVNGVVRIRDPLHGPYSVSAKDFLTAWKKNSRIVVMTSKKDNHGN